MTVRFPRIASLAGVESLRARLGELGVDLPLDDTPDVDVLGTPLELPGAGWAPNRFVVQPMEGWDGEPDGAPSDLVHRRWRAFGRSGAGWVWGGEAAAVAPDGRANPRQIMATPHHADGLGALRADLDDAVAGSGRDAPVVGLQLTHSGRWARRADGQPAPRVAFREPDLDARVPGLDDAALLSDEDLDRIVEQLAAGARTAAAAGFTFVDVKHCHGYLLHELLAARERPGRYGGPTLAERTRFATAAIGAVRDAAPGLAIGVRLSWFDLPPGRFGVDDEREPAAFVRLLADLGVTMLNVTGGSPYYVPHAQRPAAFPPSDGYAPPEDPLVGVARLVHAARSAKEAAPELVVVASGVTYLQEYVGHAASAVVRAGWCDAVGLGRMMLSYPELPADVLAGRELAGERLCRTFSDCTTAPRNGMISGCYPLDPFYKARPERAQLLQIKRAARAARG